MNWRQWVGLGLVAGLLIASPALAAGSYDLSCWTADGGGYGLGASDGQPGHQLAISRQLEPAQRPDLQPVLHF